METDIYKRIKGYMKKVYPNTLIRFDTSGLNIFNENDRILIKNLNERGFPDLQILAKRANKIGMFLEIKEENTILFNNYGKPINKHVEEQKTILEKLNENGYYACFAVGFSDAIFRINGYLKYNKIYPDIVFKTPSLFEI